MASKLKIRVNERVTEIASAPDTPLLYVLSDELQLQGPRFGCGLAQCGSCSVLLNGEEIRSCVTPVSAVAGKSVTTLEGLPQWYAKQKKLRTVPALHPVQQGVIDEQGFQCAFCMSGFLMATVGFLKTNPNPTRQQLAHGISGNLCRCQDYNKILDAMMRGAENLRRAASHA